MTLAEIVGLIIGLIALGGSIYGFVELYEWWATKQKQRRLAEKRREQSMAPAGPFRLLNFAHPITPEQKATLEEYLQVTIDTENIVDRPMHLAHDELFEDQVRRILDGIPLSSEEWQTAGFAVNLPGFAPATAIVLAEIHGRSGHFPTVLRLRPVVGSSPQVYEVAEVMNLQLVRDRARQGR